MSGSFDRFRHRPVTAVAQALGIKILRHPSSWSLSPCPSCSSPRRHTKTRDKRGACGTSARNPTGWACYQCGETGDTIDLVSWSVAGARFREAGDRRGEVLDWIRGFEGDGAPTRPVRTLVPPTPALPKWPPWEEVVAVWSHGIPVDADEEALRYLAERPKPPRVDGRLLDYDTARVVPPGLDLPPWGRPGKDRPAWPALGLRLMVPLREPSTGNIRSLIFRTVREITGGWPPKSAGPNRKGLSMLRLTEDRAPWVVREGEVDFLHECAVNPKSNVIGVISGSIGPELAERIPTAARVVIATDADKAGDAYARALENLIGWRCRTRRAAPAYDDPMP